MEVYAAMLSQLHTQDMHTTCQGGVHCQASHYSFIFFTWVQRLYKAAGEDARHQYTMTLGLPEFARAKANADNLSEASLPPC